MEKIAVVIPCLNEEKTVGLVVADYRANFPDASIYVYDNGSTDKTALLAKEAGADVRYVSKKGKGCAVRQALKDIDAIAYVLVDGDNTYPVCDGTKAMTDIVLSKNADLVIGNRRGYFTNNKQLLHSLGNKMVPFLFRMFYGVKEIDILSGSRVLSYTAAKSFKCESDGFCIETEMMLDAIDKKYHVLSCPIEYQNRPEGSYSKINTLKDGMGIIHLILKSIIK